MVDAGEWAERVDTQDVSLINVTDSLTFKQLLNVFPDISASLTRHQLTDDTIENLWDLRVTFIEGDIVLTTPEITTWVAFTLQTNNKPPVKTWRLSYKPISGATVTVDISGQVSVFRLIDTGRGVALYHFRIEATSSAVTVA